MKNKNELTLFTKFNEIERNIDFEFQLPIINFHIDSKFDIFFNEEKNQNTSNTSLATIIKTPQLKTKFNYYNSYVSVNEEYFFTTCVEIFYKNLRGQIKEINLKNSLDPIRKTVRSEITLTLREEFFLEKISLDKNAIIEATYLKEMIALNKWVLKTSFNRNESNEITSINFQLNHYLQCKESINDFKSLKSENT